MAILISNENTLQQYLQLKFIEILKDTMDELLDKLLDYITEEVYVGWNPTFYDRTYEFLNSWETEKPKILGKWINSAIYQNESIMDWRQDYFQHGSNNPVWSNENEEHPLSQIINSGHIGDAFGFPQIGARPFWDKFEQYCNANFYNIFQKHAKKYGLNGVFI